MSLRGCAPRVAVALTPLAEEARVAESMSPRAALCLHARMLDVFAASLDHRFVLRCARASELEPPGTPVDLFIDGWIAPKRRWLGSRRRPDPDPDIRLTVDETQRGHVIAHVRSLYFPEDIQRKGAGRALLAAFEQVWSAMGAQEIEAHAGTYAGERALTAWGYQPGPDELGLPTYSKALGR
jgi:GNAT superfamily N-acetyltransferase